MPVPVREILLRFVGERLERRDSAEQGRVAHPRGGDRGVRAEREVFRHPLGEPERGHELGERSQSVARFAAREDIVLERVHHLVREHVLEAAIVTGEVEEHPVAPGFGYAGRAFTQIARDVVLAEVGARREEHDRLLLAELMVEDTREARIRAFGHARGDDRGGSFFRIEVNEKVLRLEHLPFELVVLNLVLAEIILGVRRRARGGEEREAGDESQTPAPPSCHARAPWALSTGTSTASAHNRSSW
jgi:hypothetical protein